MKVLIYGYYGFKNLGDELILSKIIEDIKSIDSKAEITVCTGDINYTRKIHGVNGIDRFSPDALRDAVKQSDVVVVGGGGLIHEYFCIDIKDIFNAFGRMVAANSIAPIIAKSMQKPVFYWGHGIGPIFTEEGRNFTRWFYGLPDFTTLRDADSYNILKKIYPEVKNVYVDTDPVMSLDINRFIKPIPIELPGDKIKIGINIRPWFGIEGIIKEVSDALNEVLKENKKFVIVPVPFDLSNDKESLRKFASSLPEGSVFEYGFENFDTPEEVISLMNRLDFFVGMRLHAIIVSRLLKIPAFSISYDLKTDKFADILKIPAIRTEELTKNNFLFQLRTLLNTDGKGLRDLECSYKTPDLFKAFIEGNLPPAKVSADDSAEVTGPNELLTYENFIKSLRAEIIELNHKYNALESELNRVYASDFWKVASFYYRLRDKIPLTKYLHRTLRSLRREGFKKTIGKIRDRLIKETITVNSSEINTREYEKNPYTNFKLLKDIQVLVLDIDFQAEGILVPFSLVTTIRNESIGIIDFLNSIERQSLRPEEVIIVDGGSTDRTIELVEEYIKDSKLCIKFIKSPPVNIAEGRNIGIKEARNELVVLTDAGCRLDADFCKNLVGCFSHLDDVDLAGGIYKPMHKASTYLTIDWHSVNWQEFTPSARSIAIKKSLALKIGGFPEYLTLTGEDTLFDINYRRVSGKWVFNKKSLIYWNSPKTAEEAFKIAYTYGKGDGDSGVGDFRFHEMFYERLKHYRNHGKINLKNPVNKGLFMGYLEGRKNRSNIEIDRRNVKGVILMLSEAPFADLDGEWTKVAKRFIARGYKVIFVNVYRHTLKEQKIWFDIDYTLLELYSARDFDWEEFVERYYKKIPDRTFVLNNTYHPVLASIIEKLKAKTGNSIKVFEGYEIQEDSLNIDDSEVKVPLTASLEGKVSALRDEISKKDRKISELKEDMISHLHSERDNFNSQLTAFYSSNFSKLASWYYRTTDKSPILRSFYAIARKFKLSVLNSKFLHYLLKFRDYSKYYGVKEALRRSYRKLKKLARGNARDMKNNIIIKPSTLNWNILQTANGNSYDIISFPIMPWFSRFQRSQQLLTKFASNGTRIFRIDRGFNLDNKNKYVMEKVQENILHVTLNSSKNLNIYTDHLDDNFLNIMLQSIDSLRIDHMISNAVSIVELPFWYPLAKRLKERYGWEIVYDCMDEHEGFSTNEGQMLSAEAILSMESSLVVVTSRYLSDKMTKYNNNCVLIPNAADFKHFSQLPENDFLKDIQKPIIGYYGAISEWFDIEIIEYAANARKDWNFILIGGNDSGIDLSVLKKLPNIKLLGEKPYSELPRYLYWFDVCLIPFKLNKLTEATNPVKFYEYISSGKPVVSVRLPELLLMGDCLYLADGKEDFVKKIAAALEENNNGIRQRRIELARNNTWDKRYETFKGAIDKLYPKVSIIIVTYNNLELTKACIDSIYSNSRYPEFDLIIVDNNSQDGTQKYLTEISANHKNIKLILNNDNKGFAPANNQGIRMADGDYIILLNNDTIVTPGWITRLLRYLKDKSIGMVGPVTNMCGNEAIISVPYDVVTLDGFREFVREYYKSHPEPDCFEIDMLSMFCVALRRETVDEIGALDERFKVGTFEDTDYSQRLKLEGYKLICARDVFIHHYCRASFGKLPTEEYLRIYAENKRKFEEKWGVTSQY